MLSTINQSVSKHWRDVTHLTGNYDSQPKIVDLCESIYITGRFHYSGEWQDQLVHKKINQIVTIKFPFLSLS